MDTINMDLLLQFENGLNPAYPEKSDIPPRILGYGEISTTFVIDDLNPGIAFKRMPPFKDENSVAEYKQTVCEYCYLLNECSIKVPDYRVLDMENRYGERIVYVAQPVLQAESIGNVIVKEGDDDTFVALMEAVCRKLCAVYLWNQDNLPARSLGIDGQISNWSFQADGSDLFYFDITTPLYRKNGHEQLDTEIFLSSCPPLLVWLVKYFFLQEVLDRYYDLRLVLIDIAANFYKEGRPDRIRAAMEIFSNICRDSGVNLEPFSEDEVSSYYKNDAFIWSLFLRLRKIQRFFSTRLLSKRYNFILPGNIQR